LVMSFAEDSQYLRTKYLGGVMFVIHDVDGVGVRFLLLTITRGYGWITCGMKLDMVSDKSSYEKNKRHKSITYIKYGSKSRAEFSAEPLFLMSEQAIEVAGTPKANCSKFTMRSGNIPGSARDMT